MYFKNTYNPLIVISILNLNNIVFTENDIICDCGVKMTTLSKEAMKRGIVSYEGFIGLPGTVAGATYNNSGCYGSLISRVLKKVEILTHTGKIKILDVDEINYSHRTSDFKNGVIKCVILRTFFKIEYTDDIELFKQKADLNKQHRKNYQEGPKQNLGSIFTSTPYLSVKLKDVPSEKLIGYLYYRISIMLFRRLIKNHGSKQVRVQKMMKSYFLFLFDYQYLDKYISNRNINCFLWKDEDADFFFYDYLKFMKKITNNSPIEIEIKEN